ncbi:MAG TPA: thioredoxin [Actinobacteria bacterium]|nr:thioredoxin [Actinomycetota bacterium]
MTGVWILIGVLLLATMFGLWFRRVNGRVRDTRPAGLAMVGPNDPPAAIEEPTPQAIALAEALEGRLGERATMVQFSSAFCQPCRATRRILEEVSVMVPGVSHVEIDAEENLELVRALDIRRTPTVLFLDRAGVVRKQASGQPRKADVVAALGEILPGGAPDFVI